MTGLQGLFFWGFLLVFGIVMYAGELSGLCTRIGLAPSPHPPLHEVRLGDVHIALLPVRFDAARWRADFLSQWPPGSAAWRSYFNRISRGPAFTAPQSLPSAAQPLHRFA